MVKFIYSLGLSSVAVLLIVSGAAHGALQKTYDVNADPDTTLASNTAIDIVEHAGGIWLATPAGINFSLDSGKTWLLYNSGNGLKQDDVSALFSMNGRLWVGTAYFENVTYSDTLQYTDNLGQTWETVDLEQPGATVPHAFGPQRVIYDVGGATAQGDEWMFMANWAGGFVASREGGQSWRRLFYNYLDSANFQRAYTIGEQLHYRNLGFSVAADTSHGDSMYVWVGTAQGVVQYVFAPRENKPNSRYTTDIILCPECVPGESTYVFIGGSGGVTRASVAGQPFHSAFVEDGLPGPYITDLFAFAGRLFAGTADSSAGGATGLAYSDDGAETFTSVPAFFPFTAADEKIRDMAAVNGRLYAAAQAGGLFVSLDTGVTWTGLWVDSTNPTTANGWNVVWALDALGDTLRVGTDSGLVTLYMDPTGAYSVADGSFYRFPERPNRNSDGSGTRVVGVYSQIFEDSVGVFDSLAVWTINRPVTDTGAPAIYRLAEVTLGDTTFVLADGPYQPGVLTNDLAFYGDTVFAAGSAGLRWTANGTNPSTSYRVRDSSSPDEFLNDTITVMTVSGDTVLVGSSFGFAITQTFGETMPYGDVRRYDIYRPNTDSLAADFALNHVPQNSGLSETLRTWNLLGGFIPAMGLQQVPDQPFPRIWVSCQPVIDPTETSGISVAEYVEADAGTGRYELQWRPVYESRYFVWNFAFHDSMVFAAADTTGLLMAHESDLTVWDTIPIIDRDDRYLVDPGEPVYAVEVIDSFLWVGTGQATVKMRLDDTLFAESAVFWVDSTTAQDEVYAFPVPIRQSSAQVAQFHFTVEQTARVTLEVYDAAMNLVSRVIDNQELPPGVYQGRNSGVPTWDGRNGRGDEVAVGVYYFKVEYSTGEVRWGKLAVIP